MKILTHVRLIVLTAFAGAAAYPWPAAAQAADELKRQVRQLGFQSLYPMSSDATPGVLYLEQKDADGNRTRTVLCEDLFPGAKPTALAALPSVTSNSSGDTKVSLSLLPGIFKGKANADANFAATGVSKATLSFKQPRISRLQALVSANGTVRSISKACTAGIAPFFDAQGKANADIYLIARTLNVGGLAYDVTVSRERSAGLKAALTKLLGLDFTFKKTSETTAQISFDAIPGEPLVAGINAVRIKKLKMINMVAFANGARAIIAGDKAPLSTRAISFVLKK